jgi:hypothetical protein
VRFQGTIPAFTRANEATGQESKKMNAFNSLSRKFAKFADKTFLKIFSLCRGNGHVLSTYTGEDENLDPASSNPAPRIPYHSRIQHQQNHHSTNSSNL